MKRTGQSREVMCVFYQELKRFLSLLCGFWEFEPRERLRKWVFSDRLGRSFNLVVCFVFPEPDSIWSSERWRASPCRVQELEELTISWKSSSSTTCWRQMEMLQWQFAHGAADVWLPTVIPSWRYAMNPKILPRIQPIKLISLSGALYQHISSYFKIFHLTNPLKIRASWLLPEFRNSPNPRQKFVIIILLSTRIPRTCHIPWQYRSSPLKRIVDVAFVLWIWEHGEKCNSSISLHQRNIFETILLIHGVMNKCSC